MLTTIIIMIVMLIIIMMLMILFMRAMSTSRSGKESTVEFFLDELAELELARVAPELKIIDIAGENGATVMMVVKNGDTITGNPYAIPMDILFLPKSVDKMGNSTERSSACSELFKLLSP